jgi:hypothetical protein
MSTSFLLNPATPPVMTSPARISLSDENHNQTAPQKQSFCPPGYASLASACHNARSASLTVLLFTSEFHRFCYFISLASLSQNLLLQLRCAGIKRTNP